MSYQKRDEVGKKSIAMFESGCQNFPSEDDLMTHAQVMAALYIGLMHGLGGKGFADSFLMGALREKERIVVNPHSIIAPRKN